MKKTVSLLLVAVLLSGCLPLAVAEQGPLVVSRWKKLTDLYEKIDEAGAPPQVDITSQAVSIDDLLALMGRYPGVEFHYSLRVLKKTVRWDVTELDLGYSKLRDMDELLAYLPFLPKVNSVISLGTPFTAEEMAAFVSAYPFVKYLFKLRFAHYTVRTDITAFCTKHALYTKPEDRHTSQELSALKYCRQLKALDFGHNKVDDLHFLRELPMLQILICVDNQITDLTPLEAQSELEYLELFLNPGITDIAVLAKLNKLMDLHISHCRISDISPLYGLKHLDRLWLAQNPIPQEQIDHMQALLPGCAINNTVDQHPTAEGWRQGHPRYLKIRKMFGENKYVAFP